MSKSEKRCKSWAEKSEWIEEYDCDDYFSDSQRKNKFKKDRKKSKFTDSDIFIEDMTASDAGKERNGLSKR